MSHDSVPDAESEHNRYEAEYFGPRSGFDWQGTATNLDDSYDFEDLEGSEAWSPIGASTSGPRQKVPRLLILSISGAILVFALGLLVFFGVMRTNPPPQPEFVPTGDALSEMASIPTSTPELAPPATFPETLEVSSLISEELHIALYDSQGNLISVTDAQAQPVNDEAMSGFPASLGQTQAHLPVPGLIHSLGELTFLEGAIFDEMTGQLVLVGRTDAEAPSLNLDDLRVAFHCVYSEQDPGVSIDPGPTYSTMLVRYLGPTKYTNFGLVMFDADRLLKTLSLGQDNVTGELTTSSVPEYRTELELVIRLHEFGDLQGGWHRFWYVVDQMRLQLSENHQSMTFDQASLQIKTEYLDEQLEPVTDHPSDPAAQAFADHFTEHYAEFSTEWPVLQQLTELAKLVSLAKWTQDHDIPVDPAWLNTQSVAYVDTPLTTPAITASQTLSKSAGTSVQYWTISLHGGVDLSFENEYIDGHPKLGVAALEARPSETDILWNFRSTVDSVEHRAVVIPLMPVAQIGAYRMTVNDLALPPAGELGSPCVRTYNSFETDHTEFGYGWALPLSRLEFPFPRQAYNLDQDPGQKVELYPEVVLHEANSGSRLRYVLKGAGDDRNIYYELDGQPNYYELFLSPDGTYSFRKVGFFKQDFDTEGRLLWIEDRDGNWATYQYEDGQLTRIENSSGQWVEFAYEDAQISQVTASTSESIRYIYNERGDLAEVLDQQGQRLAAYEYDEAHHLTVERDSKNHIIRRNRYDEIGRRTEWEDGSGTYRVEFTPEGARATRLRIKKDGPIQTETVPRPELLDSEGLRTFLDQAGLEFASDLTIFQELRLERIWPVADQMTFLYLVRQGGRVHLLVNDVYLEATEKELGDPDQLRTMLVETMATLQAGPIVALGRGNNEIDLQKLFPDRAIFYSEGLEPEMIAANFAAIQGTLSMNPENTAVFNGIPRDRDELENIQVASGEWALWKGISQTWDKSISEYGYQAERAESDLARQIERALQEYENIVIIVAHSTGEVVYLPDGSILDPDQFDDQARAAIQRNRPTVIMISCETAKLGRIESFAKKLLDMGAKAVIAPDSEVGARSTSQLLQRLFEFSQQGDGLLEAWRKALEDVTFADPLYRRFRILIGRHVISEQGVS